MHSLHSFELFSASVSQQNHKRRCAFENLSLPRQAAFQILLDQCQIPRSRGRSTEYRQEEKNNDCCYGQRQVPTKEVQSNYHPMVHNTAGMYFGKVNSPSCDILSNSTRSRRKRTAPSSGLKISGLRPQHSALSTQHSVAAV